jgi:predicted unusual protein kinase regulating ubiquinone biosynthesis (AarF/ABC1/UbiB family)
MSIALAQPLRRADRVRKVLSSLVRALRGRTDADSTPEAVAATLEELGVTFVKLGQTLSSRRDLLSEEYIEAFSRLRDDVGAMTAEEVRRQLEAAYSDPSDVFERFDYECVGAASIGQVHRARLWDGREVAVKVRRPDAREQVEDDLQLLKGLSRSIDALAGDSRAVRFYDVVVAFSTALQLELDYRVEAHNLHRVRAATNPYPRLSVPRPVLEHTTETVLVMEFVDGTPLGEAENIHAPEELARQVCASYLKQTLEHGFFHADPHPGNLIYSPDGTLHLIDLGMVETLTSDERRTLAGLILAIREGDPRETEIALRRTCTELHNHDPEAFAAQVAATVRHSVAMRGVEPVLGATVYELMTACVSNGLRPAAGLAGLARTLALLDEVLLCLAPDMDADAVIDDNAGKLLGSRLMGGTDPSLARQLRLADLAGGVPARAADVLTQLARGELTVQVDAFDEDRTFANLQKIANRIAAAVVIAALLMSGALLADLGGPQVLGITVHSVLLLATGLVSACMLLFAALWFDRN